jgi:integrase
MARPKAQVEGVYEKNPGSGVWYTRLRVNSKLVRKAIGTYAEAKAYIEKARTLRRTGEGVVPDTAKRPALTFDELERAKQAEGGATVGKLCDDFLTYVKKHPKEYKDQRNPPFRVNLIRQEFGERPAASIRPRDIADWLDSIEGKAPATLNRLKATFSAIYRYGMERDTVDSNPARLVKQRKMHNAVVRFLSPKEEERIRAVLQKAVDDCPPRNTQMRKRLLHRIYEFDVSLGTGMRKGEQYNLCWPDIDFEARSITVQDSKNGHPRTVPMIDDVYDALKALQKMQLTRKDRAKDTPNPSPSDVVFGLSDNKRWWEATLKAAEVKNYRWHDNRHTFCSRLAQSGASLKVIQEAAGHKTIQMAARYAHLHQPHLSEAMAVLNRKR